MRRSDTPDEVRIVAASSAVALAAGLAEELGVPLEHLETRRFANENLLCEARELDVADRDVYLCATSRPPVSEHLLELLFGLRALRSAGPRRLTAVVAYFPYARSDRPGAPGAPVPARQVVDWIERAGADRIVTFDLHAPQIAGFARVPCVDLRARDVLVEAVRGWGREPLAVGSPDLGGGKRASDVADALGAPFVLLRKRRRAEETVVLDLLGEVRDRTLLLVDDEIATGGTILSAAALALEKGARAVAAAATHPVFAGDALARLLESPLERIVVTDTLPLASERHASKLEVVSIVPTLASALRGGWRVATGS
jgi:ribose-phosphate pyrophosphokinase